MNRLVLAIFISLTGLNLCAADEKLAWHNAKELQTEGKGWTDTKDYYDRLPARAEKMVRPPVWSLSHDSAGMCVRFVTDAPTISGRWILRKEQRGMPPMAPSGGSGLDR